jgi:3-carboxy-cis,cis-muconate cycloisomerase
MRENLEATGGLIMTERLATLLADRLGREAAHDRLRDLSERAHRTRRTLTDLLMEDETVRQTLSAEQIEAVMSPSSYLGSAEAFIDRALTLYEGRD